MNCHIFPSQNGLDCLKEQKMFTSQYGYLMIHDQYHRGKSQLLYVFQFVTLGAQEDKL